MFNKNKSTPGPGEYNLIQNSQTKTFIFNSRPQSAIYQQSISPGPGTYSFHQVSNRSCSFGTAKKEIDLEKSFTKPGPGSYNIDAKVEKKKLTRIERLLRPKLMVRSYYNAKEDKSLQQQKELQQKKQRPKSAYNTRQEARRKKINKARKQLQIELQQPGPGSYEVKDFIQIDNINERKHGQRQKKREQSTLNLNEIGPGSYQIKDFLSQQDYLKHGTDNLGFGTSKRFTELKQSELGPGFYEIIDDYY